MVRCGQCSQTFDALDNLLQSAVSNPLEQQAERDTAAERLVTEHTTPGIEDYLLEESTLADHENLDKEVALEESILEKEISSELMDFDLDFIEDEVSADEAEERAPPSPAPEWLPLAEEPEELSLSHSYEDEHVAPTEYTEHRDSASPDEIVTTTDEWQLDDEALESEHFSTIPDETVDQIIAEFFPEGEAAALPESAEPATPGLQDELDEEVQPSVTETTWQPEYAGQSERLNALSDEEESEFIAEAATEGGSTALPDDAESVTSKPEEIEDESYDEALLPEKVEEIDEEIEGLREQLLVPEIPPHRGIVGTLFWFMAALAMVGLIGVQYAYFNRMELAHNEQYRPWLERLCAMAKCDLPLRRDLDEIKLVDRTIQPHPRYEKSLLITATLVNNASFPQPFPVVEIIMMDMEQKPVASRRFQPTEYLAGARADGIFGSEVGVHLMLEVEDPGKEAVGYEFSFH